MTIDVIIVPFVMRRQPGALRGARLGSRRNISPGARRARQRSETSRRDTLMRPAARINLPRGAAAKTRARRSPSAVARGFVGIWASADRGRVMYGRGRDGG